MSGSHYAPEPDGKSRPAAALDELRREFGPAFDAIPDVDAFVREQRSGGEPAQYDVQPPDALHPLSDIAQLRAEVAQLRAALDKQRRATNGAVEILAARQAHTDHAYVRLSEMVRGLAVPDAARLDRRIDELAAAHARLVDVVQVLRLKAEDDGR